MFTVDNQSSHNTWYFIAIYNVSFTRGFFFCKRHWALAVFFLLFFRKKKQQKNLRTKIILDLSRLSNSNGVQ